MTRRGSAAVFFVANVLAWLLLVAIMVLVPDYLGRWVSLEVSRVVGWAVASGIWVVALQPRWRARVGPLALFGVQFVTWVSAAILAMWISEASHPF